LAKEAASQSHGRATRDAHPARGTAVEEQRSGERDAEHAPEDHPEEPGAEGAVSSPAADKLPGTPDSGDRSPVGGTDQHSAE
jgi:hypothetical protein